MVAASTFPSANFISDPFRGAHLPDKSQTKLHFGPSKLSLYGLVKGIAHLIIVYY
jgi:hypothetical protein